MRQLTKPELETYLTATTPYSKELIGNIVKAAGEPITINGKGIITMTLPLSCFLKKHHRHRHKRYVILLS